MSRPRKDITFKPKNSPHWHYEWQVRGHRARGSTGTDDKALADQIALKVRADLVEQISLGRKPAAQEITVSQALGVCYRERWAGQAQAVTKAHLSRNLVRLLGADTKLSDITQATILDYRARRAGEPVRGVKDPAKARLVAPKTVNDDLVTLQTAMAHARAAGFKVADVAPRRFLLPVANGREIFLTHGEAEALLAALAPHARAPVHLALFTGLRRSEVLGLDWRRNVRLETARPELVLQVKGNKAHAAPLVPEAQTLLAALEPKSRRRMGPVFRFGNPAVACDCPRCADGKLSLAGQPIRSIKRAFKTAAKAIGRPELTFHDLRHTVASWLIQRNFPLALVKDALRHADIATTLRYAHLEHRAMAAALEVATKPAERTSDQGVAGPAVKAGRFPPISGQGTIDTSTES